MLCHSIKLIRTVSISGKVIIVVIVRRNEKTITFEKREKSNRNNGLRDLQLLMGSFESRKTTTAEKTSRKKLIQLLSIFHFMRLLQLANL